MSSPLLAPATAWDAIIHRDPAGDGRFVYGVTSTGVYCRPSCPSRRPKRANVRFFETTRGARVAGFRPCRRCRPDEAAGPAAQLADRVREAADRRLAEAPDARITLAQLGADVGVSPFHLQRTFQRVTGLSPAEYIRRRRSEQFKRELRGGRTVSRATYEAGFNSPSQAYSAAARDLGMSPAAYRQGGRGVRIRYTLQNSPVGRLLVAATDRGICAVAMGESDRQLEGELRTEYPAAQLVRADDELGDLVAAVAARFSGGEPAVALDLPGTPFQWRVWRALQEIPPGETRSYQQVAASLGRPTAARAVARACASNRAALVVPCHRVLRSDGELGGYRWGTDRKRRLLAAERAG